MHSVYLLSCSEFLYRWCELVLSHSYYETLENIYDFQGKGKSLAASDVSKKLTEQDRDTTEKTGAEDDRGCEDISSNNGIRNDKKKLLLVEAELAKHRFVLMLLFQFLVSFFKFSG